MIERHRLETSVKRTNIIDRIDREREQGIQNPEMFMKDIWTLYSLLKEKRHKGV